MFMETFNNDIWVNGSFAVRNEKVGTKKLQSVLNFNFLVKIETNFHRFSIS